MTVTETNRTSAGRLSGTRGIKKIVETLIYKTENLPSALYTLQTEGYFKSKYPHGRMFLP